MKNANFHSELLSNSTSKFNYFLSMIPRARKLLKIHENSPQVQLDVRTFNKSHERSTSHCTFRKGKKSLTSIKKHIELYEI